MERTMTTQDILIWLADLFEYPVDKVRVNSLRREIPGWDSLGMLSLMAGLDERFNIHMTDKDIGTLQSVADVLSILRLNGIISED